MPLTCACPDWEPGPGDICWREPDDYTTYRRSRGSRCKSCGKIIREGELCLEFERYRIPEYEVEVNIYGEDGEIPRAPHFMCETCGDLFFSLRELKFCGIYPDEDMRELVKEYAELRQAPVKDYSWAF